MRGNVLPLLMLAAVAGLFGMVVALPPMGGSAPRRPPMAQCEPIYSIDGRDFMKCDYDGGSCVIRSGSPFFSCYAKE